MVSNANNRFGESRRRWRMHDLFALLLFVVLVALAALRLAGFPPFVRNAVLRRWNADKRYITDVRAVRFRFPFGLYLDQPRVFRSGTIGPPILEAERVALTFNPLQWLRRRPGVTGVIVDRAVIRRYPFDPDAPLHPIPWRLPDGEQGRMAFRQVDITGLNIAHGTVDYRVDGEWVWFDNAYVVLAPDEDAGVVKGSGALHLAQRRYIGQGEGACHPHLLIPLAEQWDIDVRELIEPLDAYEELPRMHLSFSGKIRPPANTFEGDGTLKFEKFSYNGVPLAALVADGAYEYDGKLSLLDIRHAVGMAAGGVIMGKALCNFTEGIIDVDFTGATSPLTSLDLLDLPVLNVLRELAFQGFTKWRVQGIVDYRAEEQTDLEIECAGEKVAVRDVDVGNFEIKGRFEGNILAFQEIDASIFDGSVTGTFFVADQEPGEPSNYWFDLDIQGIDFKRLVTASMTGRNPDLYEGSLSVQLSGNGVAVDDWLPLLRAEGVMRIRDGRIFRIPLFGGLSRMLSRLIPGLDIVLMQTRARAEFTVADNRLNVSDGRIQGEVFHVEGHGVHDFGGELDFQVQLRLLRDHSVLSGALRTLTLPLSKLFEFRLRGSVEKPSWYPVNFSSDLLLRIRDLLD